MGDYAPNILSQFYNAGYPLLFQCLLIHQSGMLSNFGYLDQFL